MCKGGAGAWDPAQKRFRDLRSRRKKEVIRHLLKYDEDEDDEKENHGIHYSQHVGLHMVMLDPFVAV